MSQNAKKFTFSLIATTLFVGIATVFGSYILDPFQIYHSSYLAKNSYLKNDRYQNAGLINRLLIEGKCCDTLLLGTSHSQNFLPDHVQKTLKVKGVLDLTMSGAQATEQKLLLQRILPSPHIKNIIWGLHITYSDAGLFEINNKELLSLSSDKYFPLYLYDSNKMNDIKYLASIDAYLNSLEHFKSGEKYNRLKSWYNQNKPSFNKADYLRNKHSKIIKKTHTSSNAKHHNYFPNIDEIIIPYVKKYPDINFYFFIPPYSKHYYANMDQGLYDKLMAMRSYAAQKLSPYKNVHLYAFDNIFEGTYDLNRYKDLAHFDEDISKDIIVFISNNAGNLDTSNINLHIRNHTNNVNEYINNIKNLEH